MIFKKYRTNSILENKNEETNPPVSAAASTLIEEQSMDEDQIALFQVKILLV